MVCYEEGSAQCIVLNMMPGAISKRITLMVRPSNKVSTLFNDIKNHMQVENFDISLQTSTEEEETLINENEDKTLSEVGIDFSSSKNRTTIKLVPISNSVHRRSAIVSEADSTLPSSLDDEELALGASASPVEPTSSPIPLPLFSEDRVTRNHDSISFYPPSSSRSSSGYVGLVNQAMTCYLNSLLQALYMTPEFRNALYNWEHDDNGDAIKNIPYQLQRLFVNLQTSSKMSVETTDLTKSFGWDSTEAWQQHDIQELCRVMFDTLEQKFKGTAQADFINRLYEGKMIDYVKCLECGTEKSREDKFLDIPLPVRPFGSTNAYSSVEEALRAFVEPETLDGNNQYHCDKCNKKCNAHKGLKFSKFPYILTLHLKRFDFDYQTLLRIKLNDKVTFPQTLNLNSFIKDTDANNPFANSTTASSNHCDTTSSEHGSVESAIKCDDCSTTDSGSILEEDVASNNIANSNHHQRDSDTQDDDEGIDMTSNSTDGKSVLANEPGPYKYELFSIMIHSGSASGGHYYAYIKEFENGEWFCFNDQSVSPISKEDIEKSYGGSLGTRTFYSSAYSSSTNAYMLMYRQIDPRRNASAIKREEFPEHIKQLQEQLQKDEIDKKSKSAEYNLQKYKVYWFDPRTQQMNNVRMFLDSDTTLEEALESAHKRLKLQNIAPLSRCRLVAYDSNEENVQCSFDGKESEQIRDLLCELSSSELLLEIRNENAKFDVYVPGDIETKVYTVDTCSAEIDGPFNVRVHKNDRVKKYKALLSQHLDIPIDDILLATFKYSASAALLDQDNAILSDEDINHKSKVFVASKSRSNDVKRFLKIVGRSNHIISLYFTLPKTDKETLEKLSIPSYDPSATKTSPRIQNNLANSLTMNRSSSSTRHADEGDVVDAVMSSPPIVQLDYRHSTISAHSQMEPAESNSEDSSLSDGDRTLVGDVSPMLSASNSPACSDQHLSSPEDHTKINGDAYGDDDTDMLDVNQTKKYYFKATYCEEPIIGDYNDEEPIRRTLSVLVDNHMNIDNLKRVLEPYIRVPKEYFKIFRHNSSQNEVECTRLNEDLRSFSDGERLTIELGRALRSGEHKCKVYYMKLSEVNETSETSESLPFLCDWILCSGASVGKTKRELLAQVASNSPQYDIPIECCRLRKRSAGAPTKVFLDDQIFGDDVTLLSNNEIILQELDSPDQQVKDDKSLTIFIRRWNPSQMALGPFNEITIYDNENIKTILSQHSGIAEENIEFAKVTGTFPQYKNSVSILEIQNSLLWNSNPTTLNEFPLSNAQDGIMFYYRDKTEELKQLSPTERQELENQRNNYGNSSYDRMSRRRERALKIYVDSSPKKRDE